MPMTLANPAPRNFAAAAGVITRAVDAGVFPGAVILIARGGEVLYHEAFGSRSIVPERTPMAPDTVFDLSSLTKPLATTALVMLLTREGKLRPDDRVTRFVQNFGVHGKIGVTMRHLLAHCSGLPAWRPFYRDIARAAAGRPNHLASRGAREFVYEQIHREQLEYPTGTQAVYSDLGFLLLGELIELVAQAPLDRVFHERIVRPLGLRSTGFVDLGRLRRDKLVPVTDTIAPTEQMPVAREAPLRRGARRQRVGRGRRRRPRRPVLDGGRRPHPRVLAAGVRVRERLHPAGRAGARASGRVKEAYPIRRGRSAGTRRRPRAPAPERA